MIVVHVGVNANDDYLARREPHRPAHPERAVLLREQGILIGARPPPDGRPADLFYRLHRPEELAPLVAEDPYYLGQVWTRYTARSFSQFVEPWERPPVVLNGSRRVTVVKSRHQGGVGLDVRPRRNGAGATTTSGRAIQP